jgi:uncharacterized protein YbjT (DUF2867 family)
MKVLILGASGMIGQGVLRECLRDAQVSAVLSLGRSPCGTVDAKLSEYLQPDLADLSRVQPVLVGLDACFFCLGVSSVRMPPAEYERITYGLTISVAQALLGANPQLTFVYVSGQGTDSSEQGRSRWARVKGRTENQLRAMPFKAIYLFRPGAVQPLHGSSSKTRLYRWLYLLLGPLLGLARRLFPHAIATTEQLGRAMILVARQGHPTPVLEAAEIIRLGSS